MLTAGKRQFATVNVNTFDAADRFLQAADSVSYDAESEADRRARRAANWTPARVVIGHAG